MSAQHTPGAWVVSAASFDEETGDVQYTLEGVKLIRKADARLIAAAPELLEALIELRRVADDKMAFKSELVAACQKADAAIAKATGQ